MSNMDSNRRVPQYTFYNGASNNPDNFQHMVAFFPDNSQYIIIGFEDMYNGGDMDCNDLMFVVDVGPNNSAASRSPQQPAQVSRIPLVRSRRHYGPMVRKPLAVRFKAPVRIDSLKTFRP